MLTVADIAATQDFYQRALGMRKASFGEGRQALHFGRQKINLHRAGHEFEPKARHADTRLRRSLLHRRDSA